MNKSSNFKTNKYRLVFFFKNCFFNIKKKLETVLMIIQDSLDIKS